MVPVNLKQLLSVEKILPFYAERRDVDSSRLPPIAVELHWTSDCNYDCIHCSYGSRRQNRGRLSQEVITSVIEAMIAMGVRAVYLSGGGEPTMVKGWERHARRLLDSGVEVALITNGVALSAGQADILGRMNYIAVSVYSTDEVEYRKTTDSHYFERQWTTPGLVKTGREKAIVGARCVVNNINFRSIVSIYLKALSSGYDYVIFIPAVDYENRGVALGPDELEQVKVLLTDNRHRFDSRRTNALDLLTRNVSHYSVSDYRLDFGEPPSKCSAVKIRANAFVNYCGGVWLCQPHIGNARYRIGDLNEQGFSELWNSSRHVEVAERLNREFSEGACRNCRSIGFNKAADRFDNGLANFDKKSLDPFI